MPEVGLPNPCARVLFRSYQTIFRRHSTSSPGVREGLPYGAEDAYPLASLQAGMLFHNEAASATPSACGEISTSVYE